jgi:hypothetical protein
MSVIDVNEFASATPSVRSYRPPLVASVESIASRGQPRVATAWSGVLLAVGAVLAAVGAVLPYEEFVVLVHRHAVGTMTFTGLGTRSHTGRPGLGFVHAGNAGKVVLLLSVLLLGCAAAILAKRGRLWLGIVIALLSALTVIMALASVAAPKSDATTLNQLATASVTVHALGRVGADIALAGAMVAVAAAGLAISVRRRRAG